MKEHSGSTRSASAGSPTSCSSGCSAANGPSGSRHVSERPDLLERAWELTRDTLPEYNNHGDVLNEYWGRLTEERSDFQFHLVGDDGEPVARARSIPVRWDGTIDDLPAGIDGAIARGFDEGGANVLCALVIMVPRALQSQGLSRLAVEAMVGIAREHGLGTLIAPVRPNWKERYALPGERGLCVPSGPDDGADRP